MAGKAFEGESVFTDQATGLQLAVAGDGRQARVRVLNLEATAIRDPQHLVRLMREAAAFMPRDAEYRHDDRIG